MNGEHSPAGDESFDAARLRRLVRLCEVSAATHSAIVHLRDAQELYREVCRIAVELGGLRMAWVGLLDDAGTRLVPVAFYGHEDGYLGTLDVSLLDSPVARGPCVRSIRERRAIHTVEIETDPSMAPWRVEAAKRGYRSSAAFPLLVEGRSIGLYSVFSASPGHFDREELQLLGSIAQNLSLAVESHRRREAREQAEEALRKSEERFQLSARASAAGLWDWDLASGEVWFSPRCAEMLGYAPGELGSRADVGAKLIHPDDLARIERAVEAHTSGEAERLDVDVRMRAKSGAWLWIHCTAQAVFDASGRATRMVGSNSDITERRLAQLALEESELRFRELAGHVHEVFWIIDAARSKTLYVSPAYESIWGQSCESLYASWTAWLDAVHPDDRARVERVVRGTDPPQAHDEVYRIHRPDGSMRWIRDRGYPVRDACGEVYRVVGTAEDITEQKKLEAQLLRTQRLESIGRLAGGVAHDLNNTLHPITLATELLATGESDPERLRLFETIESSARRGKEMVQQVLAFARGGVDSKLSRVDLGVVAREVRNVLRNTFPKNVELVIDEAPGLWRVDADATQLHQVLVNLCVNARDAMPGGGKILIMLCNELARAEPCGEPKRLVQLRVIDGGAGIAPEHLEQLFDPFFSTKEAGQGTGLGLPTVLRIVEGHGGTIDVESQVGQGTSVHIRLPAASSGSPSEAPPSSTKRLPRGQGELVLVVDDEQSIQFVAKMTLERFGYRVLVASQGEEALRLHRARAQEIDLVLTDVSMPVMDGPTLVRELRSLNPGILVVASSGIATNSHHFEEHDTARTIFLPKPYSSSLLLETVRAAFEHRSVSANRPRVEP